MTPTRSGCAFRSMLFLPAPRIELLHKVPRWRPDVVVVDLEDAVAPADKEAARSTGVVEANLRRDGTTVIVRVNAPASPWFDDDLEAVRDSGAAGVAVPKVDDTEVLTYVASRLRGGPAAPVVVAGIETAAGVTDARRILAGACTAAYFGAEDYAADVGGRRTPESLEVLHARSEVVLAGRLAQVPVVDQAVVHIEDDDAYMADAQRGRDLGYAGKICLHPRQVALAHAVFTPTAGEVDAAKRLIEAAAQGVAVVDGHMVDAVHVRLANQVLDRAAVARTPADGESSP